MSNFIMMIGLPGVGKDYFIENTLKYIYPNAIILSSDDIRKEIFNDVNDQTHNSEVFSIMRERTLNALKNGYDVIYNATNINAKKRMALLSQLPECRKIAYLMLADIDLVFHNNATRTRNVPEYVIYKMYKSFQMPHSSEDFDDIILSIYENPAYFTPLELESSLNNMCEHDNPHHTLSCGAHCQQAEIEMINLIRDSDYIYDKDYCIILLLAARYHDLCKYKCKTFDKEKGIAHFYGHEYASAYDFLTLSDGGEMFGLTKDEALLVANLINDHMSYFSGNNRVESICKRKGPVYKELLNILHTADINAH